MPYRCLVYALSVAILVFALPGYVLAEDADGIEGKYDIKGWDPGNAPVGTPDYQGSALLSQWGKTWRYHGVMDDMTYAGAAIYDPDFGTLSLSFTNGDGSERGVTHLRNDGDILKGEWAMDNGGKGELGYEIWTKK